MCLNSFTLEILALYLSIFQGKRQQFLCDIFQLHDFLYVGSDFRLVFWIRIRVNEQRRK